MNSLALASALTGPAPGSFSQPSPQDGGRALLSAGKKKQMQHTAALQGYTDLDFRLQWPFCSPRQLWDELSALSFTDKAATKQVTATDATNKRPGLSPTQIPLAYPWPSTKLSSTQGATPKSCSLS